METYLQTEVFIVNLILLISLLHDYCNLSKCFCLHGTTVPCYLLGQVSWWALWVGNPRNFQTAFLLKTII